MTELLALDPSISSAGVAIFRDGVLVAAGRITVTVAESEHCWSPLEMALAVQTWAPFFARDRSDYAPRSTLVTEWPQVYRTGKSKGDPNDLLGMAAVVGAVAGLLRPAEIVSYLPAQWIGTLPKSTRHAEAFTSPRGLRIMNRLADFERSVVPRFHDAVDAVGIGLHHLGRLDRKRVFSRPCNDCADSARCTDRGDK